ncbi:SPOR domain-containing protein [Rhodoferax saidenbachensis]|uniref:DedD protein n=1 Tax=Rhodoferax saidenbachensis TaxID=1484693 RepID=A0ABU1ZQY3_9BURK|nr:SPOR domain-containing protein [Rhodoferax saidenbachensis]MDR7307913.1 DedD protein [Rhodoferax saidenbachensis]
MAFFKFRKGGDEQPTPPTAAESVEAMRKRARHRLIGAAVLVLLGVIGFPLLFDSQPRPIAVDIPIEIPDKAKVRPLGTPQVNVASGAPSQVSGGAIEGETPVPVASAPAKPEPKPEAKPAAKPEPKAETIITESKPVPKPTAKVEAKPEPKPEPKPAAPAEKPAAKVADAAKAQALLDGKPVAAAAKPAEKKSDATDGRYVVQVGAYVEAAKLREARQKVESLGFKTYTQVVGTKDAQRTRVRIGPFANKAEAQKAADKIKKLSLPAAILEL